MFVSILNCLHFSNTENILFTETVRLHFEKYRLSHRKMPVKCLHFTGILTYMQVPLFYGKNI